MWCRSCRLNRASYINYINSDSTVLAIENNERTCRYVRRDLLVPCAYEGVSTWTTHLDGSYCGCLGCGRACGLSAVFATLLASSYAHEVGKNTGASPIRAISFRCGVITPSGAERSSPAHYHLARARWGHGRPATRPRVVVYKITYSQRQLF